METPTITTVPPHEYQEGDVIEITGLREVVPPSLWQRFKATIRRMVGFA